MIDKGFNAQADLAAEAERLKAAKETEAATQTKPLTAEDAKVLELFIGGQSGTNTLLGTPNLNVVNLGDNVLNKLGTARVHHRRGLCGRIRVAGRLQI